MEILYIMDVGLATWRADISAGLHQIIPLKKIKNKWSVFFSLTKSVLYFSQMKSVFFFPVTKSVIYFSNMKSVFFLSAN